MTDVRSSRPSLPDPAERTTLPGRAPNGLPPIALEAPPPPPTLEALRIGLSMGRARLMQRGALLSMVLGLALVVVAGIVERRVGSAGAVDRALTATFNLVVPLLSFAIVSAVTGRQNLRESVWSAARYGVARRDVAFGVILAAALASAAICALSAVLAVVVAQAPGNPPFATDAFTSAWIAALAAAAYTGWFSLGSAFGRNGGVRFLPLVADFVIGGSTGIAGALLPRANAASLLGGPAPLAMTQASSSVILAASAMILGALAALRCRE
ncbi:Hypothetical protein A7982_06007 [Minicystis rosea]|nr:Hypothetical protein A7982_06007 [Minicystis rosea]